eukprot:TRINITY_DN69425_c0_g1_i1.p1 TRINITY_DN69425_c0_g1~~TRINITY_DN69425_c0_g1_i1.p1  ORF type:complete len:439 (+),score=48.58 TRINITY_DN69425_c0_g1_i1:59-1375(+)
MVDQIAEMEIDSEDSPTGGPQNQRWSVLGAFAFHAVCNQFMFMNFMADDAFRRTYDRTEEEVISLYTITLVCVLPSLVIVSVLIDEWNWIVSCVCVLCTVVSGWLRIWAAYEHSWGLTELAHALTAPGTALIFVGFAELPSKWFLEARDNALATAIAVQSAFIGWASGAFFAPLLRRSESRMRLFLLVQAIVLTICVPVFVSMHKSLPNIAVRPTTQPRDVRASRRSGRGSLIDAGHDSVSAVRVMASSPVFVLLCIAAGLFEGVGLTVPALLADDFLALNLFSRTECALLGFIFIISGSVAGFVLGLAPIGNNSGPTLGRVVLALFVLGTIALWVLDKCMWSEIPMAKSYFIVAVLTLVSGGACLGFVGSGIVLISSVVPSISASYPGSIVGFMSFAFGSVLTQAAEGSHFAICVYASLAATALWYMGIFIRRLARV